MWASVAVGTTRSMAARATTRCSEAAADCLNAVDGVFGNDTVSGGTGFDVCLVDEGDEVSQCEKVFIVPVE